MFRQLRGEGNNQVKDYTHIVTVSYWTVGRAQLYGANSQHGKIETVYTPSNDKVHDVSELYNEYVGGTNTGGTDVICTQSGQFEGTVYLGRLDTKKIITTTSKNNTQLSFYSEPELFRPSDFEQTLEIWLSTTPPPWYEEPIGGNDHSGGADLGG